MERSAIVPGRELGVSLFRLPTRLVRHHENEGVQLAVIRLDATQALFSDLRRGNLASTKLPAEFDDGHHEEGLAL